MGWVEEGWRKKEITGAICMDMAVAFPSVERSYLIKATKRDESGRGYIRTDRKFHAGPKSEDGDR